MRLANTLFTDAYKVPVRFKDISTSTLLENGVFLKFYAPGIPCYFPLGNIILNKISRAIDDVVQAAGIYWIDLPLVVKNNILEEGEPIPATFAKKFAYLKDRLSNYHLLSTPEMLIVELAKRGLVSHHQLPVRYCYRNDFIRQIHDPKGILKSRQFKMLGGISLDKDKADCEKSLAVFSQITEALLAMLCITVTVKHGSAGNFREYFYRSTEGDMWLKDGDAEAMRALSIAMMYIYADNIRLPARFRTKSNHNNRVKVTTFGLGLQRLFYCVMDQSRDEYGFNLNAALQPFEYAIIPRSAHDIAAALKLYVSYQQRKLAVLLDDRIKLATNERKKFADYIGISKIIVVDSERYTELSRGQTWQVPATDEIVAYC